ncbi:armadillo-type fold-containing protein [Cronbergia sp. UHCC 0137]|uniref:armadillo-type fold-containing protein n=1 Tax=Cronbergia sp. UHCC 0137 TaxID=3110239 RepID=UPI002B20D23C|nr:armadillo-type fold-containing protein [Cronbergia sp. UHCC 0137]MEA5620040.1 armadillo-type fold-containing protein [Cronbergia sp. UHCC 0137]
MTQASSSWQQLINQLPALKIGRPKQRNLKRLLEPGKVLGFLSLIVAMILWNWKLLLALAVGIGVMGLAYSMSKWNWQLRWLEIAQFFNTPNTRFALSVIMGGIATVITYMTIAIWLDSTSHWIAAGIIVQGLGTLLTLILLVWQLISLHNHQDEEYLDQLLNNLIVADPLKRLIAVRQLSKLINRQQIDPSVQQDIVQCLGLLLSREEETVIREAAFNSLQALDNLSIRHIR